MQVGIISPDKHLELSDIGDYYFILAHRMLNSPAYREHVMSLKGKKWMLLDNGAFELGTSIPNDALLELIGELQPNEVVAPDKPMDGPRSLTMAEEFLDLVPKDIRVCVLPHGKNMSEFIRYYREVTILEGVETIGFSIIFHKQYKHLRPHLVNYLLKADILDRSKNIHLFGLDSLAELWCYPKDLIRSVDCSLPISCAWTNVELEYCDLPERHTRTPVYANLNSTQKAVAEHYIMKLLEVAHRVG